MLSYPLSKTYEIAVNNKRNPDQFTASSYYMFE